LTPSRRQHYAHDRKARQCGEDKPLNYESIAAAEEEEEAALQSQAEHILVHDPACTSTKRRGHADSLRQRPEHGRAMAVGVDGTR
jgi:hypothetical protein